MPTDAGDPTHLRAVLVGLLGPGIGAMRRLTGGAGRQTWAVASADGDLVVQVARPSSDERVLDTVAQAAVITAARAAGVPAPPIRLAVRATPVGDVVGAEHVAGETIARRILRDEEFASARAAFVDDVAKALAALHSVGRDAAPGLVDVDQLAAWRGRLDALERTTPTFEYAFRWLEQHRPPGGCRTVIHGDFRLGNLIVDRRGLAAVIDWELAHVGDPAEDLGWLCVRSWRFGGPAPVAGIGERGALLDRYAAHGGMPVDRDTLRWWEVFGSLRWGIICMLQLDAHLSGQERSVELAAVGRRVSEVDHDLLLLLP